jgi:hypothetical protein
MEWLAKAALSAAAVGALLFIAQRFGRRAAGLMTGLPTVTAPALGWLGLEHGAGFALLAAEAGVAAGALCAVFAWTYATGVDAGLGRWRSLVIALTACALPLPWLARWPLDLGAWLLVVLPVCLVACWSLRRKARPVGPPPDCAGDARWC